MTLTHNTKTADILAFTVNLLKDSHTAILVLTSPYPVSQRTFSSLDRFFHYKRKAHKLLPNINLSQMLHILELSSA